MTATATDRVQIKNAIISVSDKLGLAEFVRGLVAAGVKIYSTGGTRKHLESEGFEVHDVATYTGFPEMMDGRVKTLHPRIFAGILCRRDRADDMAQLGQNQIESFELVVVNLYPFESTIARAGVTDAEAIEQIDIGGPSLVRAAAKNHAFVAIATEPEQYAEILEEVIGGGTSLDLRRRLAGAAFAKTARYDTAIAEYFARGAEQHDDHPEFPQRLGLQLQRRAVLRYGENPHQQGALYSYANTSAGSSAGADVVSARQLSGKELSYNNLLDLDSALAIACSLAGKAAAVVKHNNPCGAATGDNVADAIRRALAGDPVSAFGSVIGFNTTVDAAAAEVLVDPANFVEAIIAPAFEPAAVEILTTRPKWKANVRLMECGQLPAQAAPRWEHRQLAGGLLRQQADIEADPESQWTVPTEKKPTDAQWAELRFAWAIVRHVKSNAIVLTRDLGLAGAGAGQMSRVDSTEIAIRKAGDRARGAVVASDAFFPFADSIEHLAAAGIVAVIQPGGSRRDDEVIAACNQHGLPMVFTGRRHFKH